MVSIYIVLFRPVAAHCTLQYCLSHTHSYANNSVSHARHQPALREQLGVRDTLTLSLAEEGNEPATFWLPDNGCTSNVIGADRQECGR